MDAKDRDKDTKRGKEGEEGRRRRSGQTSPFREHGGLNCTQSSHNRSRSPQRAEEQMWEKVEERREEAQTSAGGAVPHDRLNCFLNQNLLLLWFVSIDLWGLSWLVSLARSKTWTKTRTRTRTRTGTFPRASHIHHTGDRV